MFHDAGSFNIQSVSPAKSPDVFVSELLKHLNKKHEETECKDLLRHFLEGICPSRIRIKLITGDGTEVDRQWDVERCPCPGCDYFQRRHPDFETHIKTHTRMCPNMEALG
jgi:hypothetical protein